jgi:hypothetical protein
LCSARDLDRDRSTAKEKDYNWLKSFLSGVDVMEGVFAAIILGIAGLVMLGFAYFNWTSTKQFAATARQVQGTVIRMVDDSEGASAPVFKFTAQNGDVLEVQEKIYRTPAGYEVGQTVQILYDPERPDQARLSKPGNLYFMPMLFGGMGALSVLLACVLLAYAIVQLFS